MYVFASSMLPQWTLVNTLLVFWFVTLIVMGFFMNISIMFRICFGAHNLYKRDRSLILATSMMGLLHVILIMVLGLAFATLENPPYFTSTLQGVAFSMIRLGAFFLTSVMTFYRYIRVCQPRSEVLNLFSAWKIVTMFLIFYMLVTAGSFCKSSLLSIGQDFWIQLFELFRFLFTNIFSVVSLLLLVATHVTVPPTNEIADESQQLLDPKVLSAENMDLFDISPEFIINYSSISKINEQLINMKLCLKKIRNLVQSMIILLTMVYLTWTMKELSKEGDVMLALICQFFDSCSIFMLYHVHLLTPYYLIRKPKKWPKYGVWLKLDRFQEKWSSWEKWWATVMDGQVIII